MTPVSNARALSTADTADGAVGRPPRTRGKRPTHGEPVVDRALTLLAAFDADHPSLSLGELCRRTGIPKTSVLRLSGRLPK